MTSKDGQELRETNQTLKKSRKSQCTEDQFEEVMNFFEETTATKQPFAAVDNAPVLSWDEMKQSFDDEVSPQARVFAERIYEHWVKMRKDRENRSLMPALKFERNQETDEGDPYVCFRRREIRQTRKTRGRDQQVTEKLKNLRIEMEKAREIVHSVKQREDCRRTQIRNERSLFQMRAEMREKIQELKIKEGDDMQLLVDQKAPKPKPRIETAGMPRGVPGLISKAPLMRADGRQLDSDMRNADEERAQAQAAIDLYIEESKVKHRNWNQAYEDLTWRPITPPLEMANRGYRQVYTGAAESQGLPTPPASIASEESADKMDVDAETPKA
ncbi:hypothetical protein LTS18_014481, partial [Coniosporium uncinatum]